MNEAKFKTLFCDNVREQGGFTIRLATSSIVGLPDIYCQMPRFAPLLLEAKFMKLTNANSNKFRRRITYRALQQYNLKSCWGVNPYTAYCLMGIEKNKELYWSLVSPSLNEIRDEHFGLFVLVTDKQLWIEKMFDKMGVATL